MRLRAAAGLVCAAMVAQTPELRFVDVAAESGLTIANTFGGKDRKDYILETTGTGAAIFDFDGDGANDIFIANGTAIGSGTCRSIGAPHTSRLGAVHAMGASHG